MISTSLTTITVDAVELKIISVLVLHMLQMLHVCAAGDSLVSPFADQRKDMMMSIPATLLPGALAA